MRRRGYSKEMSLGPILGSGSLDLIIPPSILAVLLGSLAQIPVGELLMSGVVPGFLLAVFYVLYILIRVRLQPGLAPVDVMGPVSLGEKMAALVSIAPVGIITVIVWGVMIFGLATPSEAAAIGVVGSLIVIGIYRKFSWSAVQRSLFDTVRISSMVFLIIMSAQAFSQILAFTGVTRTLVSAVTTWALPPLLVMIAMQVTLVVVGTFLDELAMMMISIPIYMPIVKELGFDPVWFGLLFLLNLHIATISPPYGLCLFVMKGVVPDASMVDIWKASVPFILMGVLAMALVMTFPGLALWLPSFMR
jgi:tripartite ATP-independent transporter DctM subunit